MRSPSSWRPAPGSSTWTTTPHPLARPRTAGQPSRRRHRVCGGRPAGPGADSGPGRGAAGLPPPRRRDAVAILHHVDDEDDPCKIVATLIAPMPPGSYLALSHPAKDIGMRPRRRWRGALTDHGGEDRFAHGFARRSRGSSAASNSSRPVWCWYQIGGHRPAPTRAFPRRYGPGSPARTSAHENRRPREPARMPSPTLPHPGTGRRRWARGQASSRLAMISALAAGVAASMQIRSMTLR